MNQQFAPIALFMFLAEAQPVGDWSLTLANYGVAGVMLIYFIWRDKRTEERREADRQRTYELQEANTKASNLMARSVAAAVLALKRLDGPTKDFAQEIQNQADGEIARTNTR